jgi:phosphohistidine phosphatase SixA
MSLPSQQTIVSVKNALPVLASAAATTASAIRPRGLRVAVATVAAAGLLGTALHLGLTRPPMPELAIDSPTGAASLAASWKEGEVIVLVRHAERCDRSNAPCLNAPDGITARGKDVAAAAGEAFAELGLQHADVYTSPLTRTRQTAAQMFGAAIPEREWLASCKKTTLGELARGKSAGRNLVLVTHSHCIEQVGKDANIPAATDPAYSAMLFITVDGQNGIPLAAGMAEAQQFIAEFGSVSGV